MTDLSRQRFLDICHFKQTGEIFLVVNIASSYWSQTLQEWCKQGAPKKIFGEPLDGITSPLLHKYFRLAPTRRLVEVDSGVHSGIKRVDILGTRFLTYNSLALPPFEINILEADDRNVTWVNASGQTVKTMKGYPERMPMYLDCPVKDRKTWDSFKVRLDPNSRERYPTRWANYVNSINSLTCPVCLQVGGFFGLLREWVGHERMLYMFYDDPSLIEDILDTLLHLELQIAKRVTKEIRIDYVSYHEDMAYKAGPLISPDMFCKFLMPRYKKLNTLLNEQGIDVILVDSDGNLDLLIPLWLECGINFIWPIEIAAGCDPVAYRKKYGSELILGGGIDKRELMKNKSAIKSEVMSKVPFLAEKGGYFPGLDHAVPPEVSFENYCYFVNLLREIGGLEKIDFQAGPPTDLPDGSGHPPISR